MKAKLLWLVVAALPLVWGCTNANSEPGSTSTIPSSTATNTPVSATAVTNQITATPPPATRVVSTNFMVPETVKLSPAATEVSKMARSGVDATVLLSFVTNSVNTFNLSADEIVYLNDLGVHAEVMSAMLRHDQQIREASVNGAVAASPTTPAPNASVWNAGAVTSAANVWQQEAPAPAPVAEVQTMVPPPPAEEIPAEATVNYFYDSLSPYGTWIDVEGYGLCWRPTVVAASPGWRPYVDSGRWLWSDSGWYWYSDYSWGWAPFHYGRWFSHPSWGWCWMPGSVWGPSWVSWRYNDAYYGWAPLPPAAYYTPTVGFTYYGSSCGVGFSFGLAWDCFTFVSYNNFCGSYYNRHRVPHGQTGSIYNNSTVINNIVDGDNNTIINQGIGADRIQAVARTEVPRVNVRTLAATAGTAGVRQENLAADGRTLAVARHEVPGGRPLVRTRNAQNPTRSSATAAPRVASGSEPSTRGTEPVRPVRGSIAGRDGSSTTGARDDISTSATRPGAQASTPPAVSAEPSSQAQSRPRNSTARTSGALIIRSSQTTSARDATTDQGAPSEAVPAPNATPWLNNTRPAATTGRPVRQAYSTPTPSQTAAPDGSTTPAQAQDAGTPSVSRPTARVDVQPAERESPFQWRETPRSQPANSITARSSVNNVTGIRSITASGAPARTSPSVTSPNPDPSVSEPAPTARIERQTPTRTYSIPAQSPTPRAYTPAVPNTTPNIQSIQRPTRAPAMQPAPAPAPTPAPPITRPSAPVQRSAPPTSDNTSGNPGPSRPGR